MCANNDSDSKSETGVGSDGDQKSTVTSEPSLFNNRITEEKRANMEHTCRPQPYARYPKDASSSHAEGADSKAGSYGEMADTSDSDSLFPSMNWDTKKHDVGSESRNSLLFTEIASLERIGSDSTDIIDMAPLCDQDQGKSYADNTDNGSYSDEAEDNYTLRSSVLHRILDNEPLNGDIVHDKTFYTKLYNKYDTRSSSRSAQKSQKPESTDITDFDQYNKLLIREEKLKNKLSSIGKRKGKILDRSKNNNHNNVLTTLNETELNHMFENSENPKDWKEQQEPDKKMRSNRNVFTSMFKSLHSPVNEAGRNEKKDYSFADYVSDCSSIPIDDDIRLEDLPIDSQPFRRPNRKLQSLYTDYDYFDNDIDIVVSMQEKVDYDFHKIDQYQNIDPKDSNLPNQKSKNILWRFLNKIDPIRIARIQRANKYQIQRKLNVRHLHQIALGGTLGVGLLLSSGKAFTIGGPLGCLLGFLIAGFVVIVTMLSFCEIVTLIPLCGGVSGIASRFVDDAFGFSLGVVYWVTYTISFPTELTAGAIMLSFYKDLEVPGPHTAGWITLFFVFTLLLNLFDIRVYGEFEYYSTIIKLLILLGLMIYMIVLNTGGSGPLHENIGFKYWNSRLSNFSEHITFGAFRPTFDVNDTGLGALNGIGGHLGRFLQVLIASVVASYAYVGTEIVIIAGSESRNPRQSIPTATKNIYVRIVIFYIVAIFLVGLNVYSGDPRLLRYFANESKPDSSVELQNRVIALIGGNHCDSEIIDWGGFTNGNQSPWVIAIQSAGLCTFASAVNAFLLYFALTAASSQLYVSSRTLYFMAIQNKAPSCFSLCTKRGVPYMSVLFTASFGLLSYLSVQNNTALIFERMVSVCATAGLLVWSGMCLSFIRFYYALKLRPDIISRNDDDYPYKSPLQPYIAYLGLFIGMFLVLSSGFIVFLKDEWSPLFFISSYGCLFLFILCYFGYRLFWRTKVQRLDQIDLDSGRREIDRVIWEDEKDYANNFREILMKGISLLI